MGRRDAGALRDAGFATRAVHAGERPDPVTRAHQTPIFQTATFSFGSAAAKEDAVDAALSWEPGRFFYSRTGNPTTAALEQKLATLEGAEDAAAGASGMAVVAAALYAHLRAGDHVVCSDDLFVITSELLENDLPRRGVAVSRVPIADLDAVRAAMRGETRLLLTETVSNPYLRVADVPALARIAGEHGALLLVDNTFLSPACSTCRSRTGPTSSCTPRRSISRATATSSPGSSRVARSSSTRSGASSTCSAPAPL